MSNTEQSSEQKKEPKKLPHFKGDRIFGGFVTFWILGLAYHIASPPPMLFFEDWIHKTRTGTMWPSPTPAWTLNNTWIPALFTFLYFTLMIHGPECMKSRERPTWLKPAVFSWNIFLSAASSWGAWRIASQLVEDWSKSPDSFGTWVHNSLMCEDPEIKRRCDTYSMICIWLMIFCYSKIPEMMDTVWLILGKKKVIFLHWFHHSSVMWFCWFAWGHGIPMGLNFAIMNLTVHSIMYAWYALAAANNWLGTGLKPTRGFSQTVTILQIIQMVFGSSITVYVLWKGDNCANEKSVVYMGFAMYSVYLLLFVHFFIRAYCRKRKPLVKTPAFALDAKLLETCNHCNGSGKLKTSMSDPKLAQKANEPQKSQNRMQ